MTGEALPLDKQVGSQLIGGSLLVQGTLYYRVTATVEMSVMQKIIAMVERDLAGGERPAMPLLDRVVRIFVPLVIALALLTGLLGWWQAESAAEVLTRMLAVLVIACPCALGIALPLAEAQLMRRLVDSGVLVRNRACLAFLGRETLFVFDKTGTVTHGHYSVLAGLETLTSVQQGALKSLALLSIHPVAQAVVRAIEVPDLPCTERCEFPGPRYPWCGCRHCVSLWLGKFSQPAGDRPDGFFQGSGRRADNDSAAFYLLGSGARTGNRPPRSRRYPPR